MNALTQQRGIIGVGANVRATDSRGETKALLEQLGAEWTEFKDRHVKKMNDLEAAVDQANTNLYAMKVGAGSSEVGPGDRVRAMTNLGDFARSGEAKALNNGLTVKAAMSGGSNPDGGYTVPQELADSIVSIQKDASAMRRLARVVMTSSSSFDQPVNVGGTGSGWVSETAARPETDTPTFENVNVPAGEVYANPAVTQGLLDDSAYNIGEFITQEIADTFNEREGAAFIAGDGVNKPLGFLAGTAPTDEPDGVRAFGTLQYIPTGEAAGFGTAPGDVLIDLIFGLRARYRQNGAWLMNSATLGTVSKMKDGDGNYLWRASFDAARPSTLLGYPVEVDEDMPDVVADAFPIAFGDFQRGYLITDRVGLRILRDPYTNKPNVMFYATKRVGGRLLDSLAIKLLKVAAA